MAAPRGVVRDVEVGALVLAEKCEELCESLERTSLKLGPNPEPVLDEGGGGIVSGGKSTGDGLPRENVPEAVEDERRLPDVGYGLNRESKVLIDECRSTPGCPSRSRILPADFGEESVP